MSKSNSDNWRTKEIVNKIGPPQPSNIKEEFASLKLTTPSHHSLEKVVSEVRG
jgi:hypothetical protein